MILRNDAKSRSIDYISKTPLLVWLKSISPLNQNTNADLKAMGSDHCSLGIGDSLSVRNIEVHGLVFRVEGERLFGNEVVGVYAEINKWWHDNLYPRLPKDIVGGYKPDICDFELHSAALRVKNIVCGVVVRIGAKLRLLSFDKSGQLPIEQRNLITHMAGLILDGKQSPDSRDGSTQSYEDESPIRPKWRIPRWWPAFRLLLGTVPLYGGRIMIVRHGYRRIRLGLLGTGLFAVGWFLLLAPIGWQGHK